MGLVLGSRCRQGGVGASALLHVQIDVPFIHQTCFRVSPAGIELFLQHIKFLTVIVLTQVTDFVSDHVIDTFRRRLDQVRIQSNHSF